VESREKDLSQNWQRIEVFLTHKEADTKHSENIGWIQEFKKNLSQIRIRIQGQKSLGSRIRMCNTANKYRYAKLD
jgi:hypothetical protein